jgi:predicted CXXCH cytochrome family protein
MMVSIAALVVLLAAPGGSEAAVNCFDCHDRGNFQKRVPHEPASSGDCLSCHNAHVARFEGLLQTKVKDLCFSCHGELEEKFSQGRVHLPVRQGECLGCHNPHSSNQDGLLKKSRSEICFDCHTELPKKFKNTHSPYAKGQCDSCHLPHQSANDNLLIKDPESLCGVCHTPKAVQQAHPGFPEKPNNCVSCHNPHGSDRPGMIKNVLHPPYEEGCNDCHTGKGTPVLIDACLECHPDVSEQMASSHNHLVRYGDNGCTACHSPHAGDDERLLKAGKERHICGACHEATFERRDSSQYKHPATEACNDCHAPHGSNYPSMMKNYPVDVCRDCHSQHVAFTHPVGLYTFDPRTGQQVTCAACHATKGTEFPFHTRGDSNKELCLPCHPEH